MCSRPLYPSHQHYRLETHVYLIVPMKQSMKDNKDFLKGKSPYNTFKPESSW